ncbi:MAG: type VI secretion system baseplate subunit TssG [SAR324 cluster bacterium]|nr:type VI secretion system baseplate subunit TssG [SAR324 cluster bacterium]
MAASSGNTSHSVTDQLLQNPGKFSYYQAIRLLERVIGEKLEDSGKIRIRPQLSLDFPESDIASIDQTQDGEGFDLQTTILGLYGISSPLPSWYTEDLLSAELEDKNFARVLLDVVHQRLYTLFYRSSQKYQLLQQVIEVQSPKYSWMLFDLLGIHQVELERFLPDPFQMLRYIALYRQQPRSATGLTTLLEDALKGVKVNITQCVRRIVPVHPKQKFELGMVNCELGENSIVGEQTEDSNGKITITLGPVSYDRFHLLLNGSQECRLMIFLIESYMTVPLDCDLEVIMAENEPKTVMLGDPLRSCLGKNTWTFSGDTFGELRAQMPLTFAKKII